MLSWRQLAIEEEALQIWSVSFTIPGSVDAAASEHREETLDDFLSYISILDCKIKDREVFQLFWKSL